MPPSVGFLDGKTRGNVLRGHYRKGIDFTAYHRIGLQEMAAIVLVPSVVSHARNPALEDRQKDHKLKASWGCTLRACLKNQTKTNTNNNNKKPLTIKENQKKVRKKARDFGLMERIGVVRK